MFIFNKYHLIRKFGAYYAGLNALAKKISSKKSVNDFGGVVFLNILATVVSLALAIFIPKIISKIDYSYWQLYIFYATYVGIMHFGLADGAYLRYGGKNYNELDSISIRSQFWILLASQAIIFLAISIIVLIFSKDYNTKITFLLLAFSLILVNPRNYLELLLQATNRVNEYAKNAIYERILFVALTLSLLIFGYYNFYFFVLSDVLAKLVILILLLYLFRGMLFGQVRITSKIRKEIMLNIIVGAKLMAANLTGLLLLGVTRYAIVTKWGLSAFGKVALILSISGLVLIFISAAGLVTYPILKRKKPSELKRLYLDLRQILVPAMFVFLLVYYPLLNLLNLWLPNYADAFTYLPIIFPLSYFEAKNQILINTYLKAYRKESKMFLVNFGCLALAILLSSLAAYYFVSLNLTILVIIITLATKSLVSELVLARHMKFKYLKENILELIIIALFIFSASILPKISLYLYSLILLIYLIIYKDKIIKAMRRLAREK